MYRDGLILSTGLREQPKNEGKTADVSPPETIESAVEKAKRAFALRKYEQAVDHYATALELV